MKVVGLLLTAALVASAQVPVPHAPGKCGGVEGADNGSIRQSTLKQQKLFGLGGEFCSDFAFAGWEGTMQLHLGEGAYDYRDLITRAVEIWNLALNRPPRDPVIEVVYDQPENHTLPSSFWDHSSSNSSSNVDDSQNVIYFKASTNEESQRGFARTRRFGDRMQEADIYINTADEEEYGPNLALSTLLLDVGETHGVYAFSNYAFSTILHELGHAIGLAHIPTAGNVMSKDFAIGAADQWTVPLKLSASVYERLSGIAITENPKLAPFIDRHEDIPSYAILTSRRLLDRMDIFTATAKLGEQEKTALACVYEY